MLQGCRNTFKGKHTAQNLKSMHSDSLVTISFTFVEKEKSLGKEVTLEITTTRVP